MRPIGVISMTRVLVEDSLVDDPLADLDGPSEQEMADLKQAQPTIEAGVDEVTAQIEVVTAEDEHASLSVLEALWKGWQDARKRLADLTGCLPAWGWA